MTIIFRIQKNFKENSRFCLTHMRTQERIRQENWRQLVRLSVAVTVFILPVGIWFAQAAQKQTALLAGYAGYMILFLCITLFLYARRAQPPTFQKVQAGCYLFVALTMSFNIFVGVQPFPGRPATLFPLSYLLLEILFFLPHALLNLQMLLTEGAFLLAVWLIKDSTVWCYDMPASLTACVFGCMASFLIQDLRIREYRTQYGLQYVCEHDELTGLFNRRGFDVYIAEIYAQCMQRQSVCGILMLDIDFFKLYNDRYGHLAGDECLQRVSRALKAVAARNDAFLARFGGEEFLSVLPNTNDKAARAYAEELLHAVRHEDIQTVGGIVTVSIGLCTRIPQTENGWVKQVDCADHALYLAKDRGRNQISTWRADE